jgi:repressor of nif and glnA expression
MALGYFGGPREAGTPPDSAVDTERKIVAILEILGESSEPLGSITIARELERRGIVLSERAVRYHLRITDERGYTRATGRDGRMITQAGLEEIREALAPAHLGFIREKLEMLAFQTTFDPQNGTIVDQHFVHRQGEVR